MDRKFWIPAGFEMKSEYAQINAENIIDFRLDDNSNEIILTEDDIFKINSFISQELTKLTLVFGALNVDFLNQYYSFSYPMTIIEQNHLFGLYFVTLSFLFYKIVTFLEEIDLNTNLNQEEFNDAILSKYDEILSYFNDALLQTLDIPHWSKFITRNNTEFLNSVMKPYVDMMVVFSDIAFLKTSKFLTEQHESFELNYSNFTSLFDLHNSISSLFDGFNANQSIGIVPAGSNFTEQIVFTSIFKRLEARISVLNLWLNDFGLDLTKSIFKDISLDNFSKIAANFALYMGNIFSGLSPCETTKNAIDSKFESFVSSLPFGVTSRLQDPLSMIVYFRESEKERRHHAIQLKKQERNAKRQKDREEKALQEAALKEEIERQKQIQEAERAEEAKKLAEKERVRLAEIENKYQKRLESEKKEQQEIELANELINLHLVANHKFDVLTRIQILIDQLLDLENSKDPEMIQYKIRWYKEIVELKAEYSKEIIFEDGMSRETVFNLDDITELIKSYDLDFQTLVDKI